jgi:hypothetical protein
MNAKLLLLMVAPLLPGAGAVVEPGEDIEMNLPSSNVGVISIPITAFRVQPAASVEGVTYITIPAESMFGVVEVETPVARGSAELVRMVKVGIAVFLVTCVGLLVVVVIAATRGFR